MKNTALKIHSLILGLSLIPAMIPGMARAMGRKPLPPAPDENALLNEHVTGPVTHTEARNQGDAGFCWAYSLSGLIEGEALKQGKQITISPEYLALSHIPYEIQSLYSTFDSVDGAGPILGFLMKSLIGNMFDPEGSLSLTESLTELGEIGVLPESVFDYKFAFGIHPTLQEKLEAFTKSNLLNKDKLNEYESNPDELRQDLNDAIGINVPKPTDPFTFEGQTYTAQTFMTNYLGFDPTNYQEIAVLDGQYQNSYPTEPLTKYTHDEALEIIRAALKDNVQVPIAFLVYEDQKTAQQTGVFTPQNCNNGSCTQLVGGHAVLAVGLKDNDKQSSDPIDALIVKNSWGDIGLDDQGHVPPTSSIVPDPAGFFLITQDYLSQAESQPRQNGWSFVVPKKYLK